MSIDLRTFGRGVAECFGGASVARPVFSFGQRLTVLFGLVATGATMVIGASVIIDPPHPASQTTYSNCAPTAPAPKP
jgi:hypothetical protein